MGIDMENSIVLKADDIVKAYHTEKTNLEVLKSVSLEIEENKISVIVGASGAGKSTLLHILSGLDRPDRGEVLFDKKNIFRLNDEKLAKFRNRNIGFVFQFHHLLPEFTAEENVAIPQLIMKESLGIAKKRANDLLDLFGLSERRIINQLHYRVVSSRELL
jgi:lipoprotein-releasing system ATP-binding protein